MKNIELESLQKHLTLLSYNEQKHVADWLLNQIASKPTALIETNCQHNSCPHCHSLHVKKWGKSNGLQRYKCHDNQCGKTFNSLTKTPLARLRQREKWFKHIECLMDSLPLRAVARKLNINLTTAFRWRHRFLNAPRATQAQHVAGIVEADETFFPESCKGKRNITHRAVRKRGGMRNRLLKGETIPVLIVRDRSGHVCDFVFNSLSKENIHRCLKPIVKHDSILCTDGASWYKSFAKQSGIPHHRLITLDNQRVIGKEFHIQNVNAYMSRLKSWIARFRGVGTDYLANYLGWRRLFETAEVSESHWLKLALGKQQLKRT